MKLRNLKLTNFRQFKEKEIEFDNHWTVILAPNARGKSTIVESIYMLATGDSPWTNNDTNIIRFENEKNNDYENILSGTCRIEAEIESQDELKTISLFFQSKNRTLSKQFKIENSPTTRNKFTQSLHCILFSPDLIDKLMFEPKQRRDFLDTYISQINPDYSQVLQHYERILRQRNSLLKVLAGKKYSFRMQKPGNYEESDQSQMKFWTEQIIDLGAQVMQARIDFIDKVNEIKSDLYPARIVYQPKVSISTLEELSPLAHIKRVFQDQLEESSEKEMFVGQTLVGPHRDDWNLEKISKNLNIYGSRGEKRMAIADIIFKINLLLKEKLNEYPILLLDDVSSELDADNIELLFTTKLDRKQQILITTTHKSSIPKEVIDNAQLIEL